jgi:ribosome-associated translation inhibitor RaiA
VILNPGFTEIFKIYKQEKSIMIIQINTDKNLDMHDEYASQLEALLTEKLSRYSEHITRLELHLSDENGSNESPNDKKCVLEVRLEGRQPIAVTATGDTYDHAVNNTIDKIKSSLDTIIGKLRNH